MQEFDFLSPKTLQEACQTLERTGGRLIAGGTDVIPQMLNSRFQAETLVDLSYVEGLNTIRVEDGVVAIGSLATYAEMMASPQLQVEAPALVQAAATVGCVQTRHRGTLGGNIGNASPAGDLLPPLLVLEAEVTLASSGGERKLPLADLLCGPGHTAIRPNEMIEQIMFKRLPSSARTIFLKLGNRQGMAVSIASVALLLEIEKDGCIADARIALGAVSPTAIRCPQAEAVLKGRSYEDGLAEAAAEAAALACSPISDIRGSAAYRRHAVKVLVRRGLNRLADGQA